MWNSHLHAHRLLPLPAVVVRFVILTLLQGNCRMAVVSGFSSMYNLQTTASPRLVLGNQSIRLHAIPDFVRIRTLQGNKQSHNAIVEFQTAVTTLKRPRDGAVVELHAQIHFGSRGYFDYYNTPQFSSGFHRVLYELLVDEELTTIEFDETSKRRFRRLYVSQNNAIQSSPSDRKLARQYGLCCQVDIINYAQPHWIHADFTRQEFSSLAGLETRIQRHKPQQPLWALASTSPTWPGADALSAMVRPFSPSSAQPIGQRLFSNLFLSGSSLVTILRLLFWILVPAPELFVTLLDWSSILPRPNGRIVSAVALPVVESLLTGNLAQAQQLVFAQVLVAGQKRTVNDDTTLLVGKRNDHALNVLLSALENDHPHVQPTALLYGAMHCPDLYLKLNRLGFVTTKTDWRTAWSVLIPRFGTWLQPTMDQTARTKRNRLAVGSVPHRVGENFASSSNALAVGLVVVPVYLAIGGLDWISTLSNVEVVMRSGHFMDSALEEVLYLVRHVALYLSLGKFIIQWDCLTMDDVED